MATFSAYTHPNSQIRRDWPFQTDQATETGNARTVTFSPHMKGKLYGVNIIVTTLGTATGTGENNTYFTIRNGTTSIGTFGLGLTTATAGAAYTVQFDSGNGTAFSARPDFNLLRGSDLSVDISGAWRYSADHDATVD